MSRLQKEARSGSPRANKSEPAAEVEVGVEEEVVAEGVVAEGVEAEVGVVAEEHSKAVLEQSVQTPAQESRNLLQMQLTYQKQR